MLESTIIINEVVGDLSDVSSLVVMEWYDTDVGSSLECKPLSNGKTLPF